MFRFNITNFYSQKEKTRKTKPDKLESKSPYVSYESFENGSDFSVYIIFEIRPSPSLVDVLNVDPRKAWKEQHGGFCWLCFTCRKLYKACKRFLEGFS